MFSPATIDVSLKALKPGDIVDLVAPASACTPAHLKYLQDLLQNWGLKPRLADNIFGKDLLCANNDAQRFEGLVAALNAEDSKAILCVKGGYGSMRLIPMLNASKKPATPKLFIGMSDLTALHLFFLQNWRCPTLHAGHSETVGIDEANLNDLRNIIFGKNFMMEYSLSPLNLTPMKQELKSSITGGNLCLVQASIGTSWQIDTKNKILFLEEVNERAYRVDRMLQQLIQAGILTEVSAIIFGDFIGGNEPDGSNLVQAVLQQFAKLCAFPVYSTQGIGHGRYNKPLPLGTIATLNSHKLSVATGIS